MKSKVKEYPIRELLSLDEYIVLCQEAILEGNYNEAMRILSLLNEGGVAMDVQNWNEQKPLKSLYLRTLENKKPVA